MLSVTHPSPNRVDIELSAIIDGDMMASALDELIEASKDVEDGVMLYKIPSFSMPTGGAMMAELLRLPQLFQMIGHFRKCAVVTDIGWIQSAARLEGAMMPGLEIKTFDMADLPQAEAWLNGETSAAAEEEEEDFGENFPV